MNKSCSKCKEVKSFSNFYKSKDAKDGRQSWCIDCQKAVPRFYDGQYARNYYMRNKELCQSRNKQKRKRYINQWIEYFKTKYSNVPHCEICGKKLRWQSSHVSETVHFDHKIGNEPWKSGPQSFYSNRPCNKTNKDIWDQCDFGVLCLKCNGSLVTKKRKLWLIKACKYSGVSPEDLKGE